MIPKHSRRRASLTPDRTFSAESSEELTEQPPGSDQSSQGRTTVVLETSLVLDLTEFPELTWLTAYLNHIDSLQNECDGLTRSIQSITAEGEVYRDYWIEPYTKTKNGKVYTYYQLRWLTGERKKSGQPKVKTKHLSHHAVAEVQAAISRGHQVDALEKEQRQVEAEIERIKDLVRGTGRRLQRAISQNSNA